MERTHRTASWLAASLAAAAVGLLLQTTPDALAMRSAARSAAHGSGRPVTRGQGYLGIEFHDLSEDEVNALHLRPQARGAVVTMVDHDGPAGKAGLRAHDVIVAMNGQIIDSSYTLRRLIHEAGAGVSIGLSVLRGGKPLSLNAKLANREEVERDAMQRLTADGDGVGPPPDGAPAFSEGFVASPPAGKAAPTPSRTQQILNAMLRTGPFTGLAMETMPAQLAGFFGAGKNTGLLVNTVIANSPAALAGVRAGDVVIRVDAVTLHTTSDWTKHLRAAKGQPMTVTLLRERHEMQVTLTPDLKRHSWLVLPEVLPDGRAACVTA